MKQLHDVQGSKESSKPLVIDKDTVYIHTNVKEIVNDVGVGTGLYQYDEVQYSLDEYDEFKNKVLEQMMIDYIQTKVVTN